MHKKKKEKKKHITTAKFVSGEMVAWCLQKPQMTRSTSGTGRQQKLCSWTYKMSQSFMDILLSTPCQLRAMWLCLYLQEKNTVQWSDCEILAHVADSSVRVPCWRNSICNSFNSAGFFSPLFIPFSKFFWKLGQCVGPSVQWSRLSQSVQASQYEAIRCQEKALLT